MSTFNQKTTWADAYAENSVGGLLGGGLAEPMGGFGSFPLVIMALSIIATNIPTIYSLALTFQTILDMLAYWFAIFSAIFIEEHLILCRGKWSNYNAEDYNNWRKLLLGAASFIALSCGVAGAEVGMAQSWYIGIIGGMIRNPEFGSSQSGTTIRNVKVDNTRNIAAATTLNKNPVGYNLNHLKGRYPMGSRVVIDVSHIPYGCSVLTYPYIIPSKDTQVWPSSWMLNTDLL
ncbi:hypothetical protein F5877DRAFT_73260 [Lentinula edodes]|nr:hypothetical protein F5877DRAFT_73260 [Lentinula edodes]